MITIAIVNSKGGVGKTTLAASMAIEATREQVGRDKRSARVALVDLDPQRSLAKWWQGRTGGDQSSNPMLLDNVDDACDAVERLEYLGVEYAIFDSPPAFLGTIETCITCTDFIVIPLRASMLDVAASEDAITMARAAGAPTLLVLNDVHASEGIVTATHDWLCEQEGIALAKTMIHHRVAHTYAMIAGRTGAETVNNKIDRAAATELAALWAEIRDRAHKAAAAKREAAK
jgi:chromosome partitioning protein